MPRQSHAFLIICDPPCGQFNDVGVEGPKEDPKFTLVNCTRCKAPLPLEKFEEEKGRYARGEYPYY